MNPEDILLTAAKLAARDETEKGRKDLHTLLAALALGPVHPMRVIEPGSDGNGNQKK